MKRDVHAFYPFLRFLEKFDFLGNCPFWSIFCIQWHTFFSEFFYLFSICFIGSYISISVFHIVHLGILSFCLDQSCLRSDYLLAFSKEQFLLIFCTELSKNIIYIYIFHCPDVPQFSHSPTEGQSDASKFWQLWIKLQ